jgi:hypothetical protein
LNPRKNRSRGPVSCVLCVYRSLWYSQIITFFSTSNEKLIKKYSHKLFYANENYYYSFIYTIVIIFSSFLCCFKTCNIEFKTKLSTFLSSMKKLFQRTSFSLFYYYFSFAQEQFSVLDAQKLTKFHTFLHYDWRNRSIYAQFGRILFKVSPNNEKSRTYLLDWYS